MSIINKVTFSLLAALALFNQSQWGRADRNITPSYRLKEAIQAGGDAGIY